MDAAVVLINPKTPFNVGSAIRACSIFDVPVLRWTGRRIHRAQAQNGAGSSTRRRLPREERFKDYRHVSWREANADVISGFVRDGYTPVAVEVRDQSEWLDEFVHPVKAVYVFGPEDGSLGRETLAVCHRFVRIRSANRTPLNLAAAVNIVLHDRYVKGER